MAQNQNLGTLAQVLTVNSTANTIAFASSVTVGNSTVNSVVNSTSISMNGVQIINSAGSALSANNTLYLGGTAAASYQLNSTLAANVAALPANNASYLGGTAAASYALLSGALFTGAVNATAYTIGTTWVANASGVYMTIPLSANGGTGTAGQLLYSNGATGSPYWAAAPANYTISTGLVNTTGTITVNASYIATIAANNASYLGGTAAASYALLSGATFTGNITTGDGTSLSLGREVTNGLEGGQLNFASANSLNAAYPAWNTDVFTSVFRIFNGGASNTQVQMFGSSTGVVGLYVQGNVGIGTTSPGGKLDVQAGNTYFTVAPATYTSATVGPRPAGDGTSTFVLQANSTAGNKFDSTSAGLSVYANNSATFHTIFASNGNVGIGTNSPAYELDVYKATSAVDYIAGRFVSDAAGTGQSQTWVKFEKASTYGGAIGGYLNQGVNSGLLFGTQNGSATPTERMRITSAGIVGINTASPAGDFSLTMQNASGINAGFVALTGSGGTQVSATVYSDASYGYFGTRTAHSMQLITNGTNRVTIDSSGNINIGGSNDAGNTLRYLDIQSANTGSSAGSIIRLITSNTAGTGTTTVDIVKYKAGGFYLTNNEPGTSGFTAFNVGASERMRIDSSGRVGINTTAPVNLLTLNGGNVDDTYGMLQAVYSGTTTGVNAGFTAKNYQGTSQFMQWDINGVRIGSRIITNTGAGNVYLTYGNDTIGLTLYASGYTQAVGSLRAPIFYDTDDTAYYVNPNGASKLVSLGLGGGAGNPSSLYIKSLSGVSDGRIEVHKYYGTSASPSESLDWPTPMVALRTFQDYDRDTMMSFGLSNDAVYKTDDTVWNFRLRGITNRTTSDGNTHLDIGGPGVLYFRNTYTEQVGGSLRAPIYYDSNDTAYYTDPNSTSRLYCLSHAGGTAYFQGGRGYDQCCGDDGAISIGGDATKPPRIAWHYAGVMEGTIEGSGSGWRKIYFYDQQSVGLGVHATGQIASNQNVVAYYSDRRLKEDFEKVTDHWNVINNVTGYRFTWNERAGEIPGFINNVGKREVGLIAQDVNAVYPEAVYTRQEGPAEDPYKTILHDRFTPIFIEALKELKHEIDLLKEENIKLRELINA